MTDKVEIICSRFTGKQTTAVHYLTLETLVLVSEDSNLGASLVTAVVKNLPAVQETGVRSLGWEDPLEKKTATLQLSNWETPWTAEPGGLQSIGPQTSDMTQWLNNSSNLALSRHV